MLRQNDKNGLAPAKEAYRKGNLTEAESLLTTLLMASPDNAEAHTLRVAVAMRRGDFVRAREHAEKTVSLLPKDPTARGNLGSALMQLGDNAGALTHLDAAIAIDPEHVLARRNRGILYVALQRFDDAITDLRAALARDPGRVVARIALADALIETDQFEAAAAEIREAAKHGDELAVERSYVWGRLMFRMGRYADARRAFEAVTSQNPHEMKHYLALSAATFHCGDVRNAKKITRECFKRFPAGERAAGEPELRILVLEGFSFDHLSDIGRDPYNYAPSNFIGGMRPGRIAFTHVMTDCIDSLAAVVDLDRFDIAYNNRVVYERTREYGTAENLARITAEVPVPLINPPAAVAETTREANALRFADAERFIFPRTIRVDHGVDAAKTRTRILETLRLPIILRPLDTHIGLNAFLLESERDLDNALANQPLSSLYAIEYHDCASDDGLFRRYRFSCIDGELDSENMHAASSWNVHSTERLALDWFERGLDREELAFVDEPEATLGSRPEDLFREIIDKTKLDIYGFDFGFCRDGRIVVFEVNAAMSFSFGEDYDAFPYRVVQRDRMASRIEAYFFERAGKSADHATG